jgi:hypothetical protein
MSLLPIIISLLAIFIFQTRAQSGYSANIANWVQVRQVANTTTTSTTTPTTPPPTQKSVLSNSYSANSPPSATTSNANVNLIPRSIVGAPSVAIAGAPSTEPQQIVTNAHASGVKTVVNLNDGLKNAQENDGLEFS